MELRARIRPYARRAAMTAALGVFLVPVAAGSASAAKKKYPTIKSVRPMTVSIGETMEIRGKNFRAGKNKNTVVFKRDGARAVFVKAPVGTKKLLRLKVPSKLAEFFAIKAGAPTATRFRLRVLASRFGKKFTTAKRSPLISPEPAKAAAPPAAAPDGDCDGDGIRNGADADDDNDLLDDGTERSLGLDPCVGDTDGDGVADRFEFDCDRNGVLNRDQADDDSDLLSDTLETQIGTDPCSLDTDGDGVEDGYEYQSAKDLNEDEYQDPNAALPFPGKKPYPNPLWAGDAHEDHDGDSLTLTEEQALWKYTYGVTRTDSRTLSALSYSAGLQYSRSQLIASGGDANRRQPTLEAAGYDKQASFRNWINASGYRNVEVQDGWPWWSTTTRNEYGLFDSNRTGTETTVEVEYFDVDGDDYLSDDERDEDADGLINYDETHGRLRPEYWSSCYSTEKPYIISYPATNVVDADTDGDGVLDGADDQDFDDVPNLMELSRIASSNPYADDRGGLCKPATGLDAKNNHPGSYGRVNPFNPCLPATFSRTCPRYVSTATGAPFDDSPNWFALQ